MSATTALRRATASAVLYATALITMVGGAAAHSNHSEHADEGSGIPWFPIVVGGLLLLMVGIMVVRRMIGDDDGDAADEQTDDE